MHPGSITPLLITFNEEANLGRTLAGLSWAREIVVVDSGSTDGTLQILRDRPGARVVTRRFDTFATQCQFGVDAGLIHTPWVLSLDADYIVPSSFVDEVGGLSDTDAVAGYQVEFTYCVWGRPLRGSLYPPRNVLFRRGQGRFVDDGHGHFIELMGEARRLRTRFLHDDRKSLTRWLVSQATYMRIEAEKLSASHGRLSLADRVRRTLVLGPIAAPLYALFVKGAIADGLPGWHYALQRMAAEAILSLHLLERRWRPEYAICQDDRAGVVSKDV
jgi:Glycosyl transferase family 2